MATFADVSGAKLPQDRPIDGRSFLPQIKAQKGEPRDWSLIELNEKRFILSGNYKLDHHGNLFDLSDPMNEKVIPPEKQSAEDAAAKRKLSDILAMVPKGKKEAGDAAE
jgi:arylsulfatase A